MNELRLENLSYRYPKGDTALNSLSLCIKAGESVGVFGENGSGKSTLLKAIAGLISVDTGKIFLNGKEITDDIPAEKKRRFSVSANLSLSASDGVPESQNGIELLRFKRIGNRSSHQRDADCFENDEKSQFQTILSFGRRKATDCHRKSADPRTGPALARRIVRAPR